MNKIQSELVDHARASQILTADALGFIKVLHETFEARRKELLAKRGQLRLRIATQTSKAQEFPIVSASRDDEPWHVARIPDRLLDRRVEITGPPDRKMSVNALNSGANVWLADLEDANTSHWRNVIDGQVNLYDIARQSISYAGDSKEYVVADWNASPTVVVRPRGWHLNELNLTIDGDPVAAALVDFGLHFFHNAAILSARADGPFYYLPKLEGHLEARLWADVFELAESYLGITTGAIRATVLIETVPAALEMDDILYELRRYASGLNAGRWDYLFSMIKVFQADQEHVLPDRNSVTMTAPFMRAYTNLLVATCHQRGASAIGGMAAFIPSRRDPEVNRIAIEKVRADKRREAQDGFDGSWVAHPDLVAICREEFDAALGSEPNQIDRPRREPDVTPLMLFDIPRHVGDITEAGLRNDVFVALRYVATWLSGTGAVGINNLMEDAATAEIARSQIWQWVKTSSLLDTGDIVTSAVVEDLIREEVLSAKRDFAGTPAGDHVDDAAALVTDLSLAADLPDFLTTAAAALINQQTRSDAMQHDRGTE